MVELNGPRPYCATETTSDVRLIVAHYTSKEACCAGRKPRCVAGPLAAQISRPRGPHHLRELGEAPNHRVRGPSTCFESRVSRRVSPNIRTTRITAHEFQLFPITSAPTQCPGSRRREVGAEPGLEHRNFRDLSGLPTRALALRLHVRSHGLRGHISASETSQALRKKEPSRNLLYHVTNTHDGAREINSLRSLPV